MDSSNQLLFHTKKIDQQTGWRQTNNQIAIIKTMKPLQEWKTFWYTKRLTVSIQEPSINSIKFNINLNEFHQALISLEKVKVITPLFLTSSVRLSQNMHNS